ncbi:hypothetical protein TWF696_002022 [Orbilia brochopaga]|uniref:Uncharacterized protein n=1 Tax=Orbilia brochopaga TaxID=3140254 RepID=A0AAV9U9Z6_9PEZI
MIPTSKDVQQGVSLQPAAQGNFSEEEEEEVDPREPTGTGQSPSQNANAPGRTNPVRRHKRSGSESVTSWMVSGLNITALSGLKSTSTPIPEERDNEDDKK